MFLNVAKRASEIIDSRILGEIGGKQLKWGNGYIQRDNGNGTKEKKPDQARKIRTNILFLQCF